MAEEPKRPLKVFLCHASGDKPAVRELYKYLLREGVDAWLDEEKLLPGQDWNTEILIALQVSDAIIICLSKTSVSKEGYVQREIKEALEKAKEKPSGTIFVIPSKLDNCELPNYLRQWQSVDLSSKNGYERLMRSLHSRAEKVGAVIKPVSSEEFIDEDFENMLKQLFIEGRAAFLVENWDKAIHRFNKILSMRINYPGASEQLGEAERQRSLAKLYAEGMQACQLRNWEAAIKVLEELVRESPNYKDASKLLVAAKKQKQLIDLYTEAQQLYAAKQWKAVVKIFENIALIDENYPDPENLLLVAQTELDELQRIDEINTLYGQSVYEIDAGNWYKARSLLEQVHKTQIGFLETERLLRKVENEIVKIEELNQRNIQINTLYEQAHGLVRSKNWRKALDKIEEILKLDDQFVDKDGIFETAKMELLHEEQAIQQQNKLAATYAEAVRLLKEGKYQDALQNWQEIVALDPKYPDRQKVQSISKKQLVDLGNVRTAGSLIQKRLMVVGGSIIVLVTIIAFAMVINLVYQAGVMSRTPVATDFSVPSAVPTPLIYRVWDFNNGREYWGGDFHDTTVPLSQDGYLTLKTRGRDPKIYSPPSLEISASMTPKITVRMKVSEIDPRFRGAIYFLTDKNDYWSELNKASFLLGRSDVFEIYDIRMSDISTWQGVITQLRLEPVDQAPASELQIEIDYISVHAP